MAIGVQLDFIGGTLEQYDEVVGKMGFQARGQGAPGGLFHWATPTADGIRVIDVWESLELFEQFAKDKIGPITASVGITEPPHITVYEVHNYLTAG